MKQNGRIISATDTIEIGPKAALVTAKLAMDLGVTKGEVLQRALAMYKTIKRMERQGYRPCMLKGKTAHILEER